MTRLLHVVGAQIAPVGGDPRRDLRQVRTRGAHDPNVVPESQLYLFPELYLAGEQPFRAHVPIEGNRHRVPGPLTERIGEVARRARRWIQAGSIYEAAGSKTYNTALALRARRFVGQYLPEAVPVDAVRNE